MIDHHGLQWVGGPIPLGYRRVDKKLVVAPEEAETVQMIFRRYLELGSMGALMEELDRQGIRTKANRLADGRVRGGIRFGVGPLAHLLKPRWPNTRPVFEATLAKTERLRALRLARAKEKASTLGTG